MVFDLTKSLALLSPERQPEVGKKIELIHAAQRLLGMEPRNDSQLTWNYAIGDLDDEDDVPSAIAKELVTIDNIYKKTNYGAIIEDVMRELAFCLKKKYRITWGDTWDIVRFYGPTMLKLYCHRKILTLESVQTR